VNQAVVESTLSDDYEVCTAMSGMECLEYFRTNSRLPDVMLLDVMMPGMSGYEVCKVLRKELRFPPTLLPILMLSAKSPVGSSITQGLSMGCNDYISKPFENEVLQARVRSALQIKRLHEVELENAQHTELLHSIMPAHIVERLKGGESMIAESHENVTILFSDIVGWTNIAESLSTSQVVILLNELFSAFDELTEQHCVYKVETIGDAYMCAAGHDGSQDHASRILRFGLAMLLAVKRVHLPVAGLQLQIRVGAHTGPAYTGVVGRKVPRYCFFGDTVNIASRMESHGAPSCIHISQSTRDELQAVGLGEGESTVDRGVVEIKGKGQMSTHLVVPMGVALPQAAQPATPKACSFSSHPLLPPGSPALLQQEPPQREQEALDELRAAKAAAEESACGALSELVEAKAAAEQERCVLRGELEAAEAAREAAEKQRRAADERAAKLEVTSASTDVPADAEVSGEPAPPQRCGSLDMKQLQYFLHAKERELQHTRLDLRLQRQHLQRAREISASSLAELEAKEAEFQHTLLDLQRAAGYQQWQDWPTSSSQVLDIRTPSIGTWDGSHVATSTAKPWERVT